VRDTIIDLLKANCVLPNGLPLIVRIARREDIYSGSFITRYPDIVLEFKYGYGVGWAINTPLITRADSYNLVPGSHRGETGTCFIRNPKRITTDTIDLLDVMPSLLGLLKIKLEQSYSGQNIFTL
jgi:predicted AlkP superfamily phosphohydrolase/phosphomutase